MAGTRPIVLHYHLFKNAGTSVDRALQAHFGERWATAEGHPVRWPSHAVAHYLAARPEIAVLSSHTAALPVPKLSGATIYPIVFLRHPIDRVRSMYDFERRQSERTSASDMAKRTDLKGYVAWRLSRRADRAIRNFQTLRLASASFEPGREGERALHGLDTLPFVGVVEHFDASMARLQDWLAPAFPGFRAVATRVNTTQKAGETLKQRLSRTAEALGGPLYDELLGVNADDMALHRAALKRLADERAPERMTEEA